MEKVSYLPQKFLPTPLNYVISTSNGNTPFLFATRNANKLEEYQRILGQRVDGVDLKVPEIQDPDPLKVLEEKAKAAYVLNGGPIFVEDSSLTLVSLDNMIGPYADNETNTYTKLQAICRMYLPTQDRTAVMQVGIAIFDGKDVFSWVGKIEGTIAESPRGTNGFGFDPIFIPKGSRKTNAEMSSTEKDRVSPRRLALEELLKNPPTFGESIFALQDPSSHQLGRVSKGEIVKNRQALTFAFSLEALQLAKQKPNTALKLTTYVPFQKVMYHDGAVWEYKLNPKSASMGLVILPEVDLKVIPDGKGGKRDVRLDTDTSGNPVLLQMGPKIMEMVLASRAAEYIDMHSSDMHTHVRDVLSGKIPHVARTNTPSPVLEGILGMISHTDVVTGERLTDRQANIAIATKELGYKRESSSLKLSRKQAAKGILMLGPDNVVSSLYALGGMPPTTGSVDAIVTAAMSYMRSWISRNGVFAGNFERQLQLFKEAKKKIQSYKLPKDIEKQVISQIGFAVGCDNPTQIAREAKEFQKAGGRAVRIYTTNPDTRIIDTAKAIYQAVGLPAGRQGDDFLICVGPVTDYAQAKRLRSEANVRMFLIGHGGGENCTSLTAGGAANSIEILYSLYLDTVFNDCLIGLEGGTGTTIGALLPLLDVISLNKRGIGGFESTQGLYVQKSLNGKILPVLPYHGSASAPTQLIESYMDEGIAKKRLGLDGIVRAVEGKANYMVLDDACRSNVNKIRESRAYAGLALADQQSLSMYQLREKVAKCGHNHVGISPASSVIAGEHRSGI